MTSIGIIGGSGYTGGELLRLLINHPKVEVKYVYSRTYAGISIAEVHPSLIGELDLICTDRVDLDVDILFLCLGHGRSAAFLKEHSFSDRTRIIDLGNDFRLQADQKFGKKSFVYGLPELYKDTIKSAKNIANPGCFATAIQLALLPLASEQWITEAVHINATTGSTGAGVMPSATTHFSWRDNNFSSYKVFRHQHLGEISESLFQTLPQSEKPLFFVPNRGNFSKGIYATLYTKMELSIGELQKKYKDFYREEPFVHISENPIDLKQVINTNKCILHITVIDTMVIITSIIDNLIKGASGQAIQNMNLMMGWEEATGLRLKASGF